MATQDQFEPKLNENARRGPNLTIQERDIIIRMLRGVRIVHECAEAYGRTARCIRNLRKHTSQ
jgi:hypothetical protein